MEFLFGNQIASFEALIVLLCVILISAIFLYDGYLFLARLIGVLTPRKEYVKEKLAEQQLEATPDIPSLVIPPPSDETVHSDPIDILSHEITALEFENISGTVDDTGTIETEGPLSLSTASPISNEDESLELLPVQQENTTEGISGDNSNTESDPHIVPEETIQEAVILTEASRVHSGDSDEEIPSVSNEIGDYDTVEENSMDGRETVAGESIEIDNPIPQDIASVEGIEDTVNNIEPTEVLEAPLPVSAPPPPDISRTLENPTVLDSIKAGTHNPEKQRTVHPLSPEKRDKLIEITNTTRTLVARGQVTEARALIIEGLSLSKEHRELNIILAELYEREHRFEKAEYIYKDLAHTYPDDAEILMHLANTLAMQQKYRVSYEIYKKVLTLQGDSEEILYTLAHLASELTETDEAYEYTRIYIKQYPKNPEILWLYSQSQIARGNRRDAVETLIKLKNLTPYNQEIIDLIQKLVVEEEMAGNFGEEK